MKVAYIFASQGHTVSYKLGKMILPQLEDNAHGVEVVGMFFFEDNNYVLVKEIRWENDWQRWQRRRTYSSWVVTSVATRERLTESWWKVRR